ncbi:MAG: hypothetical protein QW607_09930 [Desulfurococcaceae archaeon]
MECVVDRVCEEEVVEIPGKYKILLYITMIIIATAVTYVYWLIARGYLEYLFSLGISVVDLLLFTISLLMLGIIAGTGFSAVKIIICRKVIKNSRGEAHD